MWKFCNGNAFVLFFWTIYGALLLCASLSTARGQLQPEPAPEVSPASPSQSPDAASGSGLPAGLPGTVQLLQQHQQQQQQQQPCDRTRRVFTEPFGEISDGPAGSNYTQDSHCEWLIKARNDSQFITLTFRSMGTECSYDYVFVYDGDSFKSPLLGSFSGKTEPQQVIATSGSMLILLYSDTNYVLEGFKAEFRVSNCPNNCSGQGKCVGHQCVCHGDWIGTDCSLHACPDECGLAEGRGTCLKEHCRCNQGYSGKSCSLHATEPVGNEWHWMSTFQGGLSPRAAHTAVYVAQTDALYVFGGYDLNNVLGSLQIYSFNKSTWEDEWGISLRSRHFPNEIDNALIKAVLHHNDDDEARRWGLKNDASFFRNILLSLTEQNFLARTQRSTPLYYAAHGNETDAAAAAAAAVETPHDLQEFLEEFTDKPRPAERYGHAVAPVDGGFVIYGGKLGDVEEGGVLSGGLSDELWLFNVTQNEGSGQWERRATNSTIRPPALTRHTITNADGVLYVFGGSLRSGEFSSKIFKLTLTRPELEQWHEVRPRGGKALDVRVVAHTTIHHRPSNSLVVYGGVVAGIARFSKLSDRMFAFQLDQRHWTEIQYPRTPLRDAYVPRERAFHTATVVGNYMLVFGGYTHRHNKDEICYDNQMYLYHLGCHTWVIQDVLGIAERSQYPKQQGVFAHAATVRNGNTLLIVGGYHGNVNADLLAYTLPAMLVVRNESTFNPEALCVLHAVFPECVANPECGWCAPDNVCYGRTMGANCTTNLQTTRCPGVCPALGDCHGCLIHGGAAGGVTGDRRGASAGGGSSAAEDVHSVASKFGLNQCIWCVQNARCHHRDENFGVCGEDTPSDEPGWWGAKGTEVQDAMQCTRLDQRPGLTFLKYLSPVNWTQPDDVSIVNATMVDFVSAVSSTHMEQHVNATIVARLLGFMRPPPNWRTGPVVERMYACATYSQATLRLGGAGAADADANNIAVNITAEQKQCRDIDWSLLQSDRFAVDFQARRIWDHSIAAHYQPSKIGLQHNGTHDVNKAFTFEYLEPFRNGTCSQYANCAHCVADAECGWCELTGRCADRSVDERLSCAADGEGAGDWQYLVIQPAKCANCSNYISCGSCVEAGLCEWWVEDARCARLGRAPMAVRAEPACPAPCPERTNCSACLEERGRCVWCAATAQCFSFSVYTSEFQFGLCREWLDQSVPFAATASAVAAANDGAVGGAGGAGGAMGGGGVSAPQPQQQCKSCGAHANCSACLQSLSCGWCFDRDNPIEGLCLEGDFNRSRTDCAAALNASAPNEYAEWAYAQCPDVDECGLGLHDCHREAKCTNTHGSYNCHCRRGFVGDGRTACVRTCYEQCQNGWCSGAPEFVCRCDLGWTGADCSVNCGCNNHSRCSEAVGTCDRCENWTEGERCERCRAGSFGNATAPEGCKPCECNGHGDVGRGVCDGQSGECWCEDNAEGARCERCAENFYGDPRNGGQCYFQCEARGMLKAGGRQGIGSHQSHKHHWGPEASECLWIVSPHTQNGSNLADSLIQFEMGEAGLNVRCGENAVYVYDGLPDLIGNTQQQQLLAVFCSRDTNPRVVEARSGHLTVHYKQGAAEGQGFNATYTVLSCLDGSCGAPHVCTERGHCACPDGWTGARCTHEVCPGNCSAALQQGQCDRGYGRCVCQEGWSGADCSQRPASGELVMTELFDSMQLSGEFEHLRKTLPRFGHSLVADRRGSLWMFGGYSLSHGPLNDIRQFDTKNNTWTQVTVESSPEARMPEGRYFHAADIMHSKQIIYVYGGLTEDGRVLGDFWQFTLTNQRWDEVSVVREGSSTDGGGELSAQPALPAMAGMSMTLVRDAEHERLLIVGGFSPAGGLNGHMYEYDFGTRRWSTVQIAEDSVTAGPVGIYGHSAVFHFTTQTLYIFGGYVFNYGKRTHLSNRLYAFDYTRKSWQLMPVFVHNNRPQARYLHSAIATEHYMLVVGGRVHQQHAVQDDNSTVDALTAYSFECNRWTALSYNGSPTVPAVGAPLLDALSAYAQAMTVDENSGIGGQTDAAYVVGGWDGSSTRSLVTRVRLPADLCELWGDGGKAQCTQLTGCSYCAQQRPANSSRCVATARAAHVCAVHDASAGQRTLTHGARCDAERWRTRRDCEAFESCRSCTAGWPQRSPVGGGNRLNGGYHAAEAEVDIGVGDEPSKCKWCEQCGKGRCVAADNPPCDSKYSKYNVGYCLELGEASAPAYEVHEPHQCPHWTLWGGECLASDCEACHRQPDCKWVPLNGRMMCASSANPELAHLNRTQTCRDRCDHQTSCVSCLHTHSLEAGFASCRWSTQLNRCISPSYQPMFCTGEVCGLVLAPDQEDRCPEPCNAYRQCATCLRHAHCGWCSRREANATEAAQSGGGDGVCTEGSLESPADHPAASTCDIIYADRNRQAVISEADEFVWNYVRCPAENECRNGHHRCDPKSQKCVDLGVGYACECGDGYRMDRDRDRCVPVCSQGCVRGQCIDPDMCQCDFGYVGANCSIQCQCNGHADCRGPDRLDECIKCGNNTIGSQCDRCRPLFVGDPRDNGECVPCSRYCHGHTDVCVARGTETALGSLSYAELERIVERGPTSDAVCLRCANRTADDRCEGCEPGHFRGDEDLRGVCHPCQCHGHGDTCDPVTGEKCNCGNNTESDATCSATSSRNSAQQCWMVQCSKCRDSYAGNPTDGHQCYKSITVESKMCFDAKTIDECKKPAPLRPGQTVFFAVQPRFMNVDIRIIVDVTQGELDLYMSPQDDSFVVTTDEATQQHHIALDNRYTWLPAPDSDAGLLRPIELSPTAVQSAAMFAMEAAAAASSNMTMVVASPPAAGSEPPAISDCHSVYRNSFTVYDRKAGPLSTYVTLRHCNTLLRVFGLKNRLVLTLPQTAHNLSATRFFLALRASNGPASYGLVFFRQDQLHIDLFVFFSVFFSCFFLFLAACVVGWKTKQAHDVRRARQRHVVEMMHMAKRPFSRVTLLIGADAAAAAAASGGLSSVTPGGNGRRKRGGGGGASGSAAQPSGSAKHAANSMSHPLQTASAAAAGNSGGTTGPLLSGSGAVRSVAIEPTADGVAAVVSVFISLPGKAQGPVSLALGSALTLATRQLVASQGGGGGGGRMLRRRGSHAHHHQQQNAAVGGAGGVLAL